MKETANGLVYANRVVHAEPIVKIHISQHRMPIAHNISELRDGESDKLPRVDHLQRYIGTWKSHKTEH